MAQSSRHGSCRTWAPVAREAPVTDYRQKHITVAGLRPGDILEYDMATIIHTPPRPAVLE